MSASGRRSAALSPQLHPSDLTALRALIVGAAREGTALARALAHWGAHVTLTDQRPKVLYQDVRDLQGPNVRLALGVSRPDLGGVDVLFLSPGVPPTAAVVQQARAQGLPISSEPRLFTQMCTAPVIGITGSSGKTTTTTLVGRMCDAQGLETWVGGNIGEPLIGRLVADASPDVAVMELSSFQLELFSPDYQGPEVAARRSSASRVVSVAGWSPHVAAITNITPNHLDRHPSMEDYIRAKTNILHYQTQDDWAVLNLDNDITRHLMNEVKGKQLAFSLEEPVAEGAYLADDVLLLRFGGQERLLCRTSDIRLRGRHNVANVLAAACCALAAGVGVDAIRQEATTFEGVPHRLEVVRIWRGITFVNDSIATSPERAIAALRSYTEPLVLLAGGRDKHLPWDTWAEVVREKVRIVVAFGEAVPIIARALESSAVEGGEAMALHCVDTMEEAVSLAARLGRAGDVVLLSPGGTSFDAFIDFEARGQRFRELVAAL